ncbi:MAG: hypothetical protein AAGA75_00465 [Cyanobacteria bacterium P01_E01_bin.6]
MTQKNWGKSEHGLHHDFPVNLITKHQAASILAISPSTLKKYRLAPDSQLIEGVHYIRFNSRNLKYVESLIRDWAINKNNYQAHQQAIEAFLSQLPCNQPNTRRKKHKK